MTVTTPPVNLSSQGPLLKKVVTHSGQTFEVQGLEEQKFYKDQQAKYLSENDFSISTDLQDLDRLLFLELMVHRATVQLSCGQDYYKAILGPADEADLRKIIKESTPLISTLKNDLGLTKAAREKEQYESVGKYLVNLRARAMEQGVHRENQLGKALALINQLFALVGAFDRSDDIERDKLGLQTSDDLLDWIRNVMRPEYDELDNYFRLHHQRYWFREI